MNIDKEKFDVAVGSLVMLEVMFRNRGEPLFADRVQDSKLLFEALEKEELPTSALQARVEALEGASKKLIDKMKEVYETPEYLAVFQLWQSHNGQYKGMKWVDEFDGLEAILKGEK